MGLRDLFSFLRRESHTEDNPPEEIKQTVQDVPQHSVEAPKEEPKQDISPALKKKLDDYNAMVSAIEAHEIQIAEKAAPKLNLDALADVTYSTITKKTKLDGLGNFVVIDTETTGLNVTGGEIIEIAAVRFRDFKPTCKFTSLLSPRKPIPEKITEITGITDEMVAGYPKFQQIAVALVDFIGEDNLVGHNLPFDLKFILKYGADPTTKKRKYYDTLAIAEKTLKKIKYKYDKEFDCYMENFDGNYDVVDYKLETLCQYYGITFPNGHRAEVDAISAGLLFEKLVQTRNG